MGEYTGLIMFLWIVGAPTIGAIVLSVAASRTTEPKTIHRASYTPTRTS
jgi:hypothetical protein